MKACCHSLGNQPGSPSVALNAAHGSRRARSRAEGEGQCSVFVQEKCQQAPLWRISAHSSVFPLIPSPFLLGMLSQKASARHFFGKKGFCKYSDLYSSLFLLCCWFQFKTIFSWKAFKSTWRWHHSRSSHDMLVLVLFRMQKKGLFSQIIWFPAKYCRTFSAKKGSQWSN